MSDLDSIGQGTMPLLRLPVELRHLIYDCVFVYHRRIIHCSHYIHWNQAAKRRQVAGIISANRQLHDEVRSHILQTHTFVAYVNALTPNIATERSQGFVREGLRILAKTLAPVHHLELHVDLKGDESCAFLLHYFRHCLNKAAQPLKTLHIEFLQDPVYPGAWFEEIDSPQRNYASLEHYSRFEDVVYAARYFRCTHPPTLEFPAEMETFLPEVCSMLRQSYSGHGRAIAQLGGDGRALHWGDDDSVVEEALTRFYFRPQSYEPPAISTTPQRHSLRELFTGKTYPAVHATGANLRDPEEKRTRQGKLWLRKGSLVDRLRTILSKTG